MRFYYVTIRHLLISLGMGILLVKYTTSVIEEFKIILIVFPMSSRIRVKLWSILSLFSTGCGQYNLYFVHWLFLICCCKRLNKEKISFKPRFCYTQVLLHFHLSAILLEVNFDEVMIFRTTKLIYAV